MKKQSFKSLTDLGRFLTPYLKEMGWSQSRLASEVGVTPAYVSSVFRTGYAPSLQFLFSVAGALGFYPEERRELFLAAFKDKPQIYVCGQQNALVWDLVSIALSISPEDEGAKEKVKEAIEVLRR